MPHHVDIAIVGAGLVGSSMACALASRPYQIALIDSQPLAARDKDSNDNDGRSIALALTSKQVYSALGLWDQLKAEAVPIQNIHISDQGQFGATRLDSKRYDVESFGYLVPAEKLIIALETYINSQNNIKRFQPFNVSHVEHNEENVVVHSGSDSISAKLLIAADGAHSFIRSKLGIECEVKQYGQTAIVGCVDVELHHNYTAYERFTKEGPLALLPRSGNRCGFIWMKPTDIADKNSTLSNEAFVAILQQVFGYRLGKLSNPSKRYAYPLSLSISKKRVQKRVVLLGNAAQTLHPIAGQGLNLALREIAELTDLLIGAKNDLLMIDKKLQEYELKRKPDITKTIRFTDRLNFLFTVDYPVLSRSRGIGLALLGAIPVLEEKIVRQNLGDSASIVSLLKGQSQQSFNA